jgi:Asp-tRNA(Asn)/Glu-tRNA(Gln) amidotransferase A subunit family amidase
LGFVGGSRAEHEGLVMDRLRANLRAAGIPVSEGDLERLEADGYIERVVDTREILAAAVSGGEPDFLAAWGESNPGKTASAQEQEGAAPERSESSGAGDDGLPETIASAAELIRLGELSPVELTERALERIATHDGELNLFQTVLADRAMEAARRAEQEIRKGEYRGPLHGVPIAAKDLLEMRGTVTTAGSKVRAEAESSVDAAVVELLDAAGAVIVGKTRLSEFAYWPGSTNPHYGPTRNPHDREHDAGGSSSGSAAAVVSGCAYGALGTDTGGSIRIPAALCGLVGLKPTFGRVSLYGCVPLAWSLDHLGPLTHTAEDAALMLEVLAGFDARDPRTRAGSGFRSVDVAKGAKDLSGLRVGVMTADGSGQELGSGETVAAWHASNRALADRGARLEEVDLSEMHVLWRVASLMLGVEASAYHASSLRTNYDMYGRFCRGRLVGAFAYGADDMLRAQRVRRTIRLKWDRLWDGVDVISTPSQPDVAPALGVAASTRFTNPFNALGWPAVTVPFGQGKGGLPLGTQIVGRPWDDGGVLRAAAAIGDTHRT